MQPTILKRDQVRVERAAPPPLGDPAGGGSPNPSAAPEHDDTREPHPADARCVRLLEEGGVVHALELTCSCGDVTVIELRYPDEGSNAEPKEEA